MTLHAASFTKSFVSLPEPIQKRKRLPNSQMFEREFRQTLQKKKKQARLKVVYYEMNGLKDGKKLREANRELWAINGELEESFDPEALQKVRDRFAHLDLVPGHYNYPELLYLK